MAKWRAKAWKIASALGNAPSKDVDEAGRSQDPEATPTSSTSAMEGMEPEESLTPRLPEPPTSFVERIMNSGSMNTGWTESPQKAVEEPWLLSEEFLPMEFLDEIHETRLRSLAADMGFSPHELIKMIIEFYIENEHDLVDMGTVEDAVILYLDNEVLI